MLTEDEKRGIAAVIQDMLRNLGYAELDMPDVPFRLHVGGIADTSRVYIRNNGYGGEKDRQHPHDGSVPGAVQALPKTQLFMVCDWADDKAKDIQEPWDTNVEFMGSCQGRLVRADGTVVGAHHSSSIGWLRHDLMHKVPKEEKDKYEIVDLLNEPCPEQFAIKKMVGGERNAG